MGTSGEWNLSTWHIVSYRSWSWPSLQSHIFPLSLQAPTQLEHHLFCNELCASYFRVLLVFFSLSSAWISPNQILWAAVFSSFWTCFQIFPTIRTVAKMEVGLFWTAGWKRNGWWRERWVVKGLLLLFVGVMYCSSPYLVTHLCSSYFRARNVVFVSDGL